MLANFVGRCSDSFPDFHDLFVAIQLWYSTTSLRTDVWVEWECHECHLDPCGGKMGVLPGVAWKKEQWLLAIYPLVNQHSNGRSPLLIGNISSSGPFSISMLVYQSVLHHISWIHFTLQCTFFFMHFVFCTTKLVPFCGMPVREALPISSYNWSGLDL